MEKLQKRVIYTNEDNEDFTVLPHKDQRYIEVAILSGNCRLYFQSAKEIEEFRSILREEAEKLFCS